MIPDKEIFLFNKSGKITENPEEMQNETLHSIFYGRGKGIQRAVNGIRTHDPQLGKLMLYQLSYYRI